MFLDLSLHGDPWGHGGSRCCSCKLLIGDRDDVEELYFAPGETHRLDELNGAYHANCARPLLSVKRAWDALKRFGG